MTILPCRNDLLVQLLNRDGYHPIVLPRTNITPPDMYLFGGERLIRWGRLDSAVPRKYLPTALEEGELPAFEYKQTSEKNASGAASFLGSALKAIGISGSPKIDLSIANGKDVTFSFAGTTYKEITAAEVAKALNKDFDPAGIAPEKLRRGELHIAYNYAYATGFTMQIGKREKGSVKLDTGEIKGIVDVGGQLDVSLVEGTTVVFSNKGEPAAFACKVGQVKPMKSGGWSFDAKEIPGFGATPDEGAERSYLMRKGVVLVVEDDAP